MLKRRLACAVALLAIVAGMSVPGPALAATLVWRLENPFRLFVDPAHTEIHRRAYESLSEVERRQPVLSIERRLSAAYPRGWAEGIYGHTCWDPVANRYKGCNGRRDDYIVPRSHRVLLRLRPKTGGGQGKGASCQFVMYPAGGKPVRKTAPCDREVAFDVPYPAGAKVSVLRRGRSVAQVRVKVRDIFIVGLGDSFASGEGNPDRPVRFSDIRTADYGLDAQGRRLKGYPARAGGWQELVDAKFRVQSAGWQSRSCHRSLYSYQLRTALQLALEDPHRAVTFVGYACAGSEISKGLFLPHKGTEWDPHPARLPQISAVSEAICGPNKPLLREYPTAYAQMGRAPELADLDLLKCYKPVRRIDLLLLSIGGNDVGFVRLLANAVLAENSVLKKVGRFAGALDGIAGAQERLRKVKDTYQALRKAAHYLLRIPWKQADRVLVTAYPTMSYKADGKTPCNGREGMDAYPAFTATARLLAEGERFGDRLYALMRRLSRRYGWTFVDSHRRQFLHHGYCAQAEDWRGRPAEELAFPRREKGQWTPFPPSRFQPYASRQRWFRTPNDAFLTANFHAEGPIARNLLSHNRIRWVHLVLASTYSGAFHPTAEGHAAIADAVVVRAREVLAKYRK